MAERPESHSLRGAPRDPPLCGARLGVVLWCSFLAACVASLVAFALVDPQAMHTGEAPHWWTTRLAVYGIGFFFFWVIAAIAAALTQFMMSTGRSR